MKDTTSLRHRLPLLYAALLLGFAMLVSTVLSGCTHTATAQGSAEGEGKLRIVATTTMLYDLTSIIGGERVEVTALMGPGIDPHLYQASAGDVTKLQEADVVVYNGLHLEGKMGDVFAALSQQDRVIICIEDGIDPSKLMADENNPEIHDPHIWFDVSIWKEAAQYMAAELSAADPAGSSIYAANLDSYLTQLTELDAYIKSRIAELPEEQRVLVTAHDAFRYFGAAYGFRVMGLQGISTAAEAGTADVSNLADFIAQEGVKAIFVESSVPPKNIEALQAAVQARGFAVVIGGALYSDSLGDAASGHDSYCLTLKANVDTIVDALN